MIRARCGLCQIDVADWEAHKASAAHQALLKETDLRQQQLLCIRTFLREVWPTMRPPLSIGSPGRLAQGPGGT